MSTHNLEALFSPRSIALIGASRRPHAVGAVVARNLLSAGFAGPIMLVNPHERAIQSVVAYKDVESLPLAPDLAVIAIPADTIPPVLEALGKRGCRAAVVLSAGFEGGATGGAAEREKLQSVAGQNGLRIVGPNCLGVMAPHGGVNASFAHVAPLPGRIACVMQSGALIASVLEWANARGIGFSKVVSIGDALDVDFGDMLNYLALDQETDAIFLYIEGLTHSRKFMAAARAAARIKPVIAMKAGRNPEAANAVRSHTGALAGSDSVYDAAFRRAGIVRIGSLEEMFDTIEILARPRKTVGDRLAIVTNGGGGGVLATDAMLGGGAKLAQLSPPTLAALNNDLPAAWSHANPVDIIGDADGQRYERTLTAVLADPAIDAVLVVNCPTAIASSEEAADAVIRARSHFSDAGAEKPVIGCWMGSAPSATARERLSNAGIANFQSPEQAVAAFAHLLDFQRNAKHLAEVGEIDPTAPVDRLAAEAILRRALQQGREWLDEADAKAVLAAYAIPAARTFRAATPDAVADAARQIGGPVAIKISSRDIPHKSDVGGVALDLRTADAAREAAIKMLGQVAAARPSATLDGFTVSEMIARPAANELIVGLTTDSTFGPVVLFGHGGVAAEQIADVALALPPLTTVLAADLVSRTRVSAQLRAFRNRPPSNLPAIHSVLIALGRMALDHPEIAELDINPLLADPTGVVALDARIRVRDPALAVPAALQAYPGDLQHVIRAKDGGEILIRPIRPDDAPALQHFIEGLDPETIRARFFETMRRLPPALLARLTQIDYDKEMAFVAIDRGGSSDPDPRDEVICGVGRIVLLPGGKKGEYALTASRTATGRGITHALMGDIIAYARTRRLEQVCGEELNDSLDLIGVAQDLGGTLSHDPDDPTTTCVVLPLAKTI